MNDTWKRFESLVHRARLDVPTEDVSVSTRVMNTLRARTPRHMRIERDLLVASTVAALAACIALWIFLSRCTYDDFLPLFQPLGASLR